MDYVNLGKTGLKVSKICLGCMSFGSPKWRSWVLDDADVKALEAPYKPKNLLGHG